jgi:hypothetical protein
VYILWLVCTRAVIIHMSVCCAKKISVDTNMFDFVTLTFMFDLLTEHFNIGCIFWIVCIRILIFHMSVCCDKILPWVPTGLTLWTWPLCSTNSKKSTLTISFEWYELRLWYFTWLFVVRRQFQWVPTCLTLWHWPLCLTYLLKTLTLDLPFEWYVLGFWYFTSVFVVTRPFRGYQQIWFCDLDLYVWSTYWKL